MTTPIPLTAVLQDRILTVVLPDKAAASVTLTMAENWIDDTSDQMVDDTGDYLIFNYAFTGNPVILTAVIQDRKLTVERT